MSQMRRQQADAYGRGALIGRAKNFWVPRPLKRSLKSGQEVIGAKGIRSELCDVSICGSGFARERRARISAIA